VSHLALSHESIDELMVRNKRAIKVLENQEDHRVTANLSRARLKELLHYMRLGCFSDTYLASKLGIAPMRISAERQAAGWNMK